MEEMAALNATNGAEDLVQAALVHLARCHGILRRMFLVRQQQQQGSVRPAFQASSRR